MNMTRRAFLCGLVGLSLVPAIATSQDGADLLSPEVMQELVGDYCMTCHNDAGLAGGMSLESFDSVHPEANAELAEKMIRKLQAGMMPPSYALQPEAAELAALQSTLVTRIDTAAVASPNPGRRTFQRLNRAEYRRSVQDLLGIDVDVAALLPPDTVSHSFDNIADVQSMSPTLMDGYLRAAGKISLAALGDRNAGASEATYKVPKTGSQLRHVEGTPFGTRGGISVVHNFPADGDYVFKIELHGSPQGFLYGTTAPDEQVEVSINGRRVALLDIDPLASEEEPGGLNLKTEPIAVRAGPQRVSAAFLKKTEGTVGDLIAPIEHTLADSHIGIAYGITTLPHLRDFTISGPYDVTGVSDTPSRRLVFTCRPTSEAEEYPCADEIVTRLAGKAYRRGTDAVDEMDHEALMSFYSLGREDGDFESGIRMALEAILASPAFVFRVEGRAADVEPGRPYRISDVDLASRLSFFLWATAPDEELLTLASEAKLSEPEVLDAQVERMLASPKAEALSTRFASQWLRLQDLDKLHPDALMFPMYDAVLADALKRETEVFFQHLVEEDRSVLELLDADYTFVNERVARHYGIPNVTGSHFRRQPLEGVNASRTGLLGHGSILALTSIANRTSPVQRGKWVMEVLLGSPPPPPPPNVPDLEETKAVEGDRRLSVREQMEMHRSNPSCNSCHSVIDPLGLALENFDVTGAWRTKDRGAPINASAELYDGTQFEGPLGLRDAILGRSEAFITSFTESLLTFALGRRVEYSDMPAVRRIVTAANADDDRITTFIKEVVRSDPFQMSVAEVEDALTTEAH